MRNESLLEVRDLRKAFGGVLANDGVNLEVAPRAIVGLIGPNGCGKSTLFNCISGHERRDGGVVKFDGRLLEGLSEAEIARLGLVRTFQQAHVYERMTCIDNLVISGHSTGVRFRDLWVRLSRDRSERALRLLLDVGLSAKRDVPAAELSFGERKLLELAMALMSEPKMLLLDEPTAGVNPRMIARMVERLQWVNQAMGITLLVIEHNMRVVMQLAHRIYCLAQGRVLACGAPGEIRSDARVLQAYLGST
jgi:ABC-type branched-subunit amino acid transport system ATPase component